MAKLEKVKAMPHYKRLVYWMKERERVREKKEAGRKAPWTDDEILQNYRFCNVRRMDDKVSRWLYDNWYRPYFNHPNMLAAVALARFVNLPSSLERLTRFVFRKRHAPLWDEIQEELRSLRDGGGTRKPIFNGAYMVRGNDGMDKVECVVKYYVRPLVDSPPCIYPDSMENTHAAISLYYGFGSFMAGQVVADLRWAIEGTWDDKFTWAPIGPGSRRGLNRYLNRPLKTPVKQEEFNEELAKIIQYANRQLPQSVTLKLEAMDYQNCLCEFDKYERVLWGEGRPKAKYPGA